MQEFKWLRNDGVTPAECIYEGRKFSIEPGETRRFASHVADVMLEECGDDVVWDADFEYRDDLRAALDANVWVANMTGNPLYPETVAIQKYDPVSRRQYTDSVPLPAREPKHLIREMKGGSEIVSGRSGSEQRMKDPVRISIPPHRRIRLRENEADWFLKRSSNAAQHSGAPTASDAIRSRGPSDFEPDYSWDYDDVLLYAELVDARLVRNAPNKQALLAHRDMQKRKDETPQKLAARQKRHLKNKVREFIDTQLFYFLANPRVKLPTKTEFDAAKGSKQASAA